MDKHPNYDNNKRTFSQRLGEANVMPDGMLSAIDDTELAILAMVQGVNESKNEQDQQENDR